MLSKTGVVLRLAIVGSLTGLSLFLTLAFTLAMSSMALAGPTYSVTKLDDETYLTYGVGANQFEAKVSAIRHALEFATETVFYAETSLTDGQVSSATRSQINGLIKSLKITKVEDRGGEVYLEATLRLDDGDLSTLDREDLIESADNNSLVQRSQDGSLIAEGIGASKYLARQDAIRNALTYQVDQLVISEQVMDSYRMTKDIFISSMNGRIKRVELLDYRRLEDGDYYARLRVFVSEGTISESLERFTTAFERAGSSEFDTRDLAAQLLSEESERERKISQYEVAKMIIHGATNGYLAAISNAEVAKVEARPDDDNVGLTVVYRLNQNWIDGFYGRLKAAESLLFEHTWRSEHIYSKWSKWSFDWERLITDSGRRYDPFLFKAGEVCFVGPSKTQRSIYVNELPPKYSEKTGKGCLRLPIYKQFYDRPLGKEKGQYWRDGRFAEPKRYAVSPVIRRQHKLFLPALSSGERLSNKFEFLDLGRAPLFAVIYAVSADAEFSSCFSIPVRTPIYMSRRGPAVDWDSQKSSLSNKLGAVLRGDKKKLNFTQRLVVPDGGDIFYSGTRVPKTWLVNSDRSRTASHFIVKIVTAEFSSRIGQGGGMKRGYDIKIFDPSESETYDIELRGSKYAYHFKGNTLDILKDGIAKHCKDNTAKVIQGAGIN